MHIAILTFDAFNEIDSLVAFGILNRVKRPDWRVTIASPAQSVTSMNGLVVQAQSTLEQAAEAVFVAMVFDGLDGRVARWTRTSSSFGKEYDSLSDMVAFGLAPALVVYQWGVVRIAEYNAAWGRIGWLVTFLYAVAAALHRALERVSHA